MRNSWIFTALILFLSACGNPSSFRAKIFDLERVQSAAPAKGQPATGDQIVRLSGQIQYQDLKAEWNGEKVSLKGNLKLRGQDVGAVEMHGERVGEEIIFSTDNKELNGKIKAQATCISEDGICSDFFIDVLLKEDSGAIQHDQFVVIQPKVIEAPKPISGASKKVDKSYISDEVVDSKPGAYIGLSDQEVRELFVAAVTTTTSTTTTTTPTTSTNPTNTTTTMKVTAPEVVVTTTTLQPTPAEKPIVKPTVNTERAIGSPSHGRLENGVDLSVLASGKESFFALVWPTRSVHFSTLNMAELIQKMASYVHEKVAGYIFKVGDVSNINGGHVSPHASHQNGLDADLGYIVSNRRSEFRSLLSPQGLSSDFMASENWELFKKAFDEGQVELIFVHSQIKKALCAEAIRVGDLKDAKDQGPAYELLRRVKLEEGHHNHFHLRISCPKTDKRCRQPIYTLGESGCF